MTNDLRHVRDPSDPRLVTYAVVRAMLPTQSQHTRSFMVSVFSYRMVVQLIVSFSTYTRDARDVTLVCFALS